MKLRNSLISFSRQYFVALGAIKQNKTKCETRVHCLSLICDSEAINSVITVPLLGFMNNMNSLDSTEQRAAVYSSTSSGSQIYFLENKFDRNSQFPVDPDMEDV